MIGPLTSYQLVSANDFMVRHLVIVASDGGEGWATVVYGLGRLRGLMGPSYQSCEGLCFLFLQSLPDSPCRQA